VREGHCFGGVGVPKALQTYGPLHTHWKPNKEALYLRNHRSVAKHWKSTQTKLRSQRGRGGGRGGPVDNIGYMHRMKHGLPCQMRCFCLPPCRWSKQPRRKCTLRPNTSKTLFRITPVCNSGFTCSKCTSVHTLSINVETIRNMLVHHIEAVLWVT
jgi:hypothetical protein